MIASSDWQFITADEFLEQRPDMPECGQWSELTNGKVVHFQPPDVDHGNTVLNLSKLLAHYFQSIRGGYACFDLGLWMTQQPDTVVFPAVTIFLSGPMFAESDRSMTQTQPAIAIEVASTHDRRSVMPSRLESYLGWGIADVWSIDPQSRTLKVVTSTLPAQTFQEGDIVTSPGCLERLSFPVKELFHEPEWFGG